MKFHHLLVAVLAAFAISAALSFSHSAQSQTREISELQDHSRVNEVHFASGSFVKAGTGTWNELDRNGNHRFAFRETRRDGSTVFLRNDPHDVDIEMNLAERNIYGRWPGYRRHIMHRISHMKFDLFMEEIIHPEPGPPPAQPETGMRFTSIVYDGGVLKDEGAKWTDWQTGSDAIYIYDRLGQQGQDIYLYDDNGRQFFKIDIAERKIYRAVDGGPLGFHADITDMSAVSANPPSIPQTPEPEIPGRLTQSEIEECVWSQGRIERAGILGAERCTRPYSDGGKPCTDSAQCEGQCRAQSMNRAGQNGCRCLPDG